jgi:hypothetical protein
MNIDLKGGTPSVHRPAGHTDVWMRDFFNGYSISMPKYRNRCIACLPDLTECPIQP